MSEALSELGEAALGYTRLGFALVPEHEMVSDVTCSCGCAHPHCWRRAKHPRLRNWERRFTTDERVIRQWWTRWPTANIGLGLEASGLVLLDIDPREGRGDRLGEVAERFGPEALETLTARTGGGGWHLYYRAPAGVRVPNRKDFLGAGFDVQHRDGLCTIPPSRHHTHALYRWEGGGPDERPIAPLPPRLSAALARRPPPLWYVKQSPYWIADRTGMSMATRERLRRVEDALRSALRATQRRVRA